MRAEDRGWKIEDGGEKIKNETLKLKCVKFEI